MNYYMFWAAEYVGRFILGGIFFVGIAYASYKFWNKVYPHAFDY